MSPRDLNDSKRSESGYFTPLRGIASFENLVALANYQERLKEARKRVWRDRGEPVVELDELSTCINHAVSGGFRAGGLAFAIRALVNLVLALVRIRRLPRNVRIRVVLHALFGLDTWRFAAMLGTFSSTYKFLLNALPILAPSIMPSSREPFYDLEKGSALSVDYDAEPAATPNHTSSSRRPRLSLSTRARLVLIRKRTRKWHAALAGAVAGALAIGFETKSRRKLISQQLFVRGLQGTWNAYSTRWGIKIPHGDILLFSAACAQIMYAFILRPDTLPWSYNAWIQSASMVPVEGVRINRNMYLDHTVKDLTDIDAIVALPTTTAKNATHLLSLRHKLATGQTEGVYIPPYGPCAAIHPAVDRCPTLQVHRFVQVFRWMLPIYGALHLVPALLFRRHAFMKHPGAMLRRSAVGTLRSSAFLGTFVVICQALFCFKHHLHRVLSALSPKSELRALLPQICIDALVSKASIMMMGLSTGFALLVEEKRRRGELAMYVLPKALESAWVMAQGKGWVFRTRGFGDVLLTSWAMGMMMSEYQNAPQNLSGIVRRILYQFIGPN
ncbi:hypothetical protein FISHEDRAFT_41969 [Fistulina hepatica ATCC 64428]|uniref:Transmembrane protein 135 N-terminal domain-containing protein n=1 Tax=Fistulina hepatica ATCC 64428 TaxID=1128425 RepID=A0A0D7AEJ1_9AGAR|nr:hypothetical protein FISHEDRAFT_41969 [Fistulina hepatica ATCC 64428]